MKKLTTTTEIVNHNPPSAVDLLIEVYDQDFKGIVLIQRGNPPYQGQWALPGGFQEWGESLETTATREAEEETNLKTHILDQLKVYSQPGRDPRGPVNSVGYVLLAHGMPRGGDDAALAQVFPLDKIPTPLAFDHDKRIQEYLTWKRLRRTV